MTQVLNDHFVREAGEYLAELDLLLRGAEAPDFSRVFRLARGVRGSAQVAGAAPVVEVAARLEGAARFVLDGRLPWTAEVRDRYAHTVAELRDLVPAFGRGWTDGEVERLGAAAEGWGGFADARPAEPASASETDAAGAIDAFVRAELAEVVRVTGAALRELRAGAGAHAPTRRILESIRVVRGVSGAPRLQPVLEVVDGVEDLARTLATGEVPEPAARLEALDAARDALDSALRSLERGEAPHRDAPSMCRFRARYGPLATEADADGDVVPISALFFDDAGPHLVGTVSGGPAPAPPPAPPPAEDDADDGDVLPIESILLRGERALEAALALRPELERALGDTARTARARALLDELWALVILGGQGGRP
jgi:HPt (histidine-containing phosphotransfer) domain-containing protein